MVSSLYWDSSVSYEQRYAIIPNVQLSGSHSRRFIHWTVGEETDSEQGARNFNYEREKNYSSTSDWSRSAFDALKIWPEINRLMQHSVSEFKSWLLPQFLFCITIADFFKVIMMSKNNHKYYICTSGTKQRKIEDKRQYPSSNSFLTKGSSYNVEKKYSSLSNPHLATTQCNGKTPINF